ncbi:MAG: hypothetical protein MJB57_06430 [Gemmatimonadetes bacterium]|nr:hypothetical protein [Gemmatimonadota bacterium]
MVRNLPLGRAAVGLLLAAVPAAVACGDATGPAGGGLNDGVEFPPLAQDIVLDACIRGSVVPDASPSGSIEREDCNANGLFFETYRVRVNRRTDVDFEVESGFDSVLELVAIDNFGSAVPSLRPIRADDNSAGDLNALIRSILEPDTEYWIAVGGRNPLQLGSYTLRIEEN